MRKVHKASQVTDKCEATDKVILLLRDFIDSTESCMKRSKKKKYVDLFAEIMENIKWYDAQKNEKLCIYYEDILDYGWLIKNLKKVCAFLNITDSHIDEFIMNYAYHRDRSLMGYTQKNGSFTKGLKNTHRQTLSKSVISRRTDIMKALNPFLFDKYLDRYVRT